MENNNEVKLSKRVLAYLLDVILIYVIVSLLTSIRFINPYYEKYVKSYEKYADVLEQYTKGDIDTDEMISLNSTNFYKITKYSVSYNIAIIVVVLAYFILFQKFNNGQTMGKQIMKLKVVSVDKDKVSIWQYLVRLLPMYLIYIGSILPLAINSILLLFIKDKDYMMATGVVSYLFLFIFIVSAVMVMVRKDKRGLHEIISKTKVINVEK